MAVVQDRSGAFVLLSRDQSYLEMLDPRPDESFDILHYGIGSDVQHQFPGLVSANFDLYPSNPTFSANTPNCYDAQDAVLVKPKEILGPGRKQMPPSSTTSPSVSRSFDHPPSTLSSASGASAQSATSSAVGSPFSHTTSNLPGQEHWVDSQQGLGIAAGLIANESYGHEVYSLNHLEHDLNISGDKFSNFVGELEKFPSSSLSNSGPVLQSFVLPSAATPLVLNTNMVSREVAMDTMMNEINTPVCSISSAGTSVNHTPTSFRANTPAPSPTQSNGIFKSPTTPASAYSPLTPSATSPIGTRRHAFLRHPLLGGHDLRTPGIHRRAPATSTRWSPYDKPMASFKSPGRFSHDHSQSPFFGQSSGRFIAPLESSCRFSLTTSLSLSFLLLLRLFVKKTQLLLGMMRLCADVKTTRSCSYTIFGYLCYS